ncbi:MAG: DUF2791 family P-loop domain-containing protein [Gemmatimonadetes bacterium]|nr:DUF2791 family P-loop domain-containing protein [Gemmatimonadota bacterium]
MNPDRVTQRRAIEALRSGVPNRDAVRALGSTQLSIERQFEEKLDAVRSGGPAGGLLVGGDFGSGKSHLLEYLQHKGLEQGFVTSKIVISKETPLHDPTKVFRSAVANALVPDRRGAALTEISQKLRFDSPRYAEFNEWVNTAESSLNERFAATLFLFQNLRTDLEFMERIIRFWSGDPITVGELKRKLREAGEPATWTLPKVSARDLSLQRFRFVARLIAAAEYAGWVLLLDEVELIGRYSLLQRGRSYAELARWIAGFEAEPLAGLTAVLAITSDFDQAVLLDNNDRENVPNRLRARDNPADDLAATRAEQGMRIIERSLIPLERQDERALDETYRKVKRIHAEAYGWQPPDVRGAQELTSRSMREYVRSWIHEWDLRRLDPSYAPHIEVEQIETDYAESPELETPPEGEVEESEP